MIALAVSGAVLLLLSLAYVRTPFLSRPWRVVVRGSDDFQADRMVCVYVVRRFHIVSCLSREHWVKVGNVATDDPDFDERLIELQFKATEIRRRMEAVA